VPFLESQPGSGVRFSFTLPVARVEETVAAR
jgi:signal transduction histidine kinase